MNDPLRVCVAYHPVCGQLNSRTRGHGVIWPVTFKPCMRSPRLQGVFKGPLLPDCIQVPSHPSTNQAQHCLASEIVRDRACSVRYGCQTWCSESKRCQLNTATQRSIELFNADCPFWAILFLNTLTGLYWCGHFLPRYTHQTLLMWPFSSSIHSPDSIDVAILFLVDGIQTSISS